MTVDDIESGVEYVLPNGEKVIKDEDLLHSPKDGQLYQMCAGYEGSDVPVLMRYVGLADDGCRVFTNSGYTVDDLKHSHNGDAVPDAGVDGTDVAEKKFLKALIVLCKELDTIEKAHRGPKEPGEYVIDRWMRQVRELYREVYETFVNIEEEYDIADAVARS